MAKSRAEGSKALRDALSFVLKHWRTRKALLAGIALAMLFSTLTEVIVPVFAGRLVDALALGSRLDEALKAFGAMAALGLLMVVLRHLAWGGIVPFTLSMMRNIAQDAFHRVQRFSTDWHNNSFAGSTVRKITRGMWALDSLNDVLLLALFPPSVVLVATVMLLGHRWPIMGVVMAVGALVYVPLAGALARASSRPLRVCPMRWIRASAACLSDALGANAVVKSFGAEAREDARLGRVVQKWSRRTRAHLDAPHLERHGATRAALGRSHCGYGNGTVVVVAWPRHARRNHLRAHHVLRRARLSARYRPARSPVAACGERDGRDGAAVSPSRSGVADAPDARPLQITSGEVRFEHVTFRYAGQSAPLYRDMNVRIAAGERIGLVGRSGSGKTTFVKLIQRLYDVNEGRIVIDGQNVRHATQASLRSQIAIVQQEPILFHRSLAENIAYARPEASLAEIERAARLANAHEFIARLPRSYQTLVGERGVKLSGGERQRVALARAFLADAPILILDEATSSLDSESEALIQEAMARLMSGRTSIVIAHRLSTVRAMDRILVFEHGRIVEEGSHEALLCRPHGHYRRLFERQSGSNLGSMALVAS